MYFLRKVSPSDYCFIPVPNLIKLLQQHFVSLPKCPKARSNIFNKSKGSNQINKWFRWQRGEKFRWNAEWVLAQLKVASVIINRFIHEGFKALRGQVFLCCANYDWSLSDIKGNKRKAESSDGQVSWSLSKDSFSMTKKRFSRGSSPGV